MLWSRKADIRDGKQRASGRDIGGLHTTSLFLGAFIHIIIYIYSTVMFLYKYTISKNHFLLVYRNSF